MFSSFEGSTADQAWQQVKEAFRVGEGVLAQPSKGGRTKEILQAAIAATRGSDGSCLVSLR